MTHHIAADRHRRVGTAPNNFPATLPPAQSDLAAEIVADPYDLDVLAVDPGYSERQLEDAIVARLSHFLTELGAGFAFVGQYRLPVGDRDHFLDLLFFHLGLRRHIISSSRSARLNPSTSASSASTSPSSTTCSAGPSTATRPPSASCSPPTATTSSSSTPYAASTHRWPSAPTPPTEPSR